MAKWNKIYSTPEFYKADIVRVALEEREIAAIIIDKADSSYNNFGEREVYVEQENTIKAIKIIKDEVHLT